MTARCFFYLHAQSHEQPLDVRSRPLAKSQQQPTTPVYYIQYAHARVASVMIKAARRPRPQRPIAMPGLACRPPCSMTPTSMAAAQLTHRIPGSSGAWRPSTAPPHARGRDYLRDLANLFAYHLLIILTYSARHRRSSAGRARLRNARLALVLGLQQVCCATAPHAARASVAARQSM